MEKALCVKTRDRTKPVKKLSSLEGEVLFAELKEQNFGPNLTLKITGLHEPVWIRGWHDSINVGHKIRIHYYNRLNQTPLVVEAYELFDSIRVSFRYCSLGYRFIDEEK